MEYAHHLLVYFVSTAKNIYGNTYNVHNIIHLQDDVANYHLPLGLISGFAFENHLLILKKLVRNATNTVNQIIKRTHELESCGARYSRARYNFVHLISIKHKDSWFLLKCGKYANIKEINDNNIYICEIYRKDCN